MFRFVLYINFGSAYVLVWPIFVLIHSFDSIWLMFRVALSLPLYMSRVGFYFGSVCVFFIGQFSKFMNALLQSVFWFGLHFGSVHVSVRLIFQCVNVRFGYVPVQSIFRFGIFLCISVRSMLWFDLYFQTYIYVYYINVYVGSAFIWV